MHSRLNRIFFSCFILCLWLPLAAQFMGINPAALLHLPENKAARPIYSGRLEDIGGYTRALQSYYRTHFGLRDWLASVDTEIRIYWLDSHKLLLTLSIDKPSVICDYRAFYKDKVAQDALQWQAAEKRLTSQGIQFAVVIVPTKEEIGQSFACGARFIRDDYAQNVERLAPDVHIIDLFDAVRAAQKEGRTYYVTDEHWNNRGAYAGYRALITMLGWRLNIPPAMPETQFIRTQKTIAPRSVLTSFIKDSPAGETDIFYMRKSPQAYRIDAYKNQVLGQWEYNTNDEIYIRNNSRLPRAVIFQSSMFEAIKPWVAEHFSRTYYHWANTIDMDIVGKEKPNLVIQQVVR